MNEHDAIDRLLRNDAAQPLRDDGFTASVMRALPPPAARRVWLTPALVLGSTALGCLLAVGFGHLGPAIASGFTDLSRMNLSTPSAAVALAMVATGAVCALVLADD